MDRLLCAIDDQRLGLFPRDPGVAPDTEQRFRQRLDPLDRPADRAFVDTVDEAEELLRDVAAVYRPP